MSGIILNTAFSHVSDIHVTHREVWPELFVEIEILAGEDSAFILLSPQLGQKLLAGLLKAKLPTLPPQKEESDVGTDLA